MTNRTRNLGINIRVTSQEKRKIEQNAKKCKLTVSEYLRQLAMKYEPKELPSDDIFRSILRLKTLAERFYKNSEAASRENARRFYKELADSLMQIQTETLQLMTHTKQDQEVVSDGND